MAPARIIDHQAGEALPTTSRNPSLLVRVQAGVMPCNWIHWPSRNDSRARRLQGREIKAEGGRFVFSDPAMFPLITFRSRADLQGEPYHLIILTLACRCSRNAEQKDHAFPRKRFARKPWIARKAAAPMATENSAACAPRFFVSVSHAAVRCVCHLWRYITCDMLGRCTVMESIRSNHSFGLSGKVALPQTSFLPLFRDTHGVSLWRHRIDSLLGPKVKRSEPQKI